MPLIEDKIKSYDPFSPDTKTGNFIGKVNSWIQRSTPQIPVREAQPLKPQREIPKASWKDLLEAGKFLHHTIVQPFFRAGRRAAGSITQEFPKPLQPKILQDGEIAAPKSKVGKFLFGEEPVKTLQKDIPERAERHKQFFEKKGFGKNTALILGAITGAGTGLGAEALDLIPIFPEANIAKSAKVISATQDAVKLRNAVKELGVADEVIEKNLPALIAVKNEKEARTILEEIKDDHNAFITAQKAEPQVREHKDIQSKMQGVSSEGKLPPSVDEENIKNIAAEFPVTKDKLPGEPVPRKTETPGPLEQPVESQIPELPSEFPKSSSFFDDTTKIGKSKVLNVDKLKISAEGKQLVEEVADSLRGDIEKFTGKVLSNKEALDLADNSSKILNKTIGSDKTLEWEAAMLKARQKLADAAEKGVVDEDFINNLLVIKTQGTDIARKLQSLSIGAEAKEITSQQAILEAVLKTTDDVQKVLDAAKGVDFKDLNQATDFYRQFIKPKTTEWLDLIRYNSMLSSPKTHIVNFFTNTLNTLLVRPLTQAVTGGLDFLRAGVTGKERKYFVGEGGQYLKHYFSNARDATKRFSDVMKGKSEYTNLDVKHIPIATKGVKGKIVKTLAFPLRLLEASDQFFTALTEGAEKASLAFRKSKGVSVGNITKEAADQARYSLYRQELFTGNQGPVLDAVDQLTSKLNSLRNSENPIVSTISKFTVPFLRTPINIFKQGIEYSPLGVSTLIGAKNKTEQLAKAIIGSSVFGGAATMLMSNRLTWAEPTNADQKAKYRAAGMQPYSVKLGDTWYSYQKLPPAIAFPFAMTAAIDDAIRTKKIDQNTGDLILSTIAKYGQFMADQSYAKSIGDLLGAFEGGEAGIAHVVSNYNQQLVPFRALNGWLARLTDEIQRKPNTKDSFIDQQVQLLMMNIPGLSQNVPARKTKEGKQIKQPNQFWNAFLPITTSPQKGTYTYPSKKTKGTSTTSTRSSSIQSAIKNYQPK